MLRLGRDVDEGSIHRCAVGRLRRPTCFEPSAFTRGGGGATNGHLE